MNKKTKSVTIIGGADGPTSVFLIGKRRGISGIWQKILSKHLRRKQQKAMAGIKADPHTIEELISYLSEKYGAEELPKDSRRYQGARKSCRANLVQRFAPELAGGPYKIQPPEGKDEASVREYLSRVEEQLERAASVSEEDFPMDFHIYQIRCGEQGKIFVEIETIHSCISFTSSGDLKEIHKVERDILLYYGVSENDIADRTERFQMLAGVLAER